MNLPNPIGEPTELFPMKWQKTALRQKFENPRTKVEEDFIVFHSPSVCQVVFGLTSQGEVIVSRQFRYGIAMFQKEHETNPFIHELPGGGPDVHEEWCDAARREFLEETGYAPGHLVSLGPPLWIDPAATTMRFVPWLAQQCEKVKEPEHGPTEFIAVETIPAMEWYDMIYSGKIIDCRTIAISLLALPLLSKRHFIPSTRF